MNIHWLTSLFRFSCPTSSAVKAQVWFELRSSGLLVVAIGLASAVLIQLVTAISIPYVPVRIVSGLIVMVIVFATPIVMARNAFGIRHRQGRTFFSSFEAIQPLGTAQLAGVKLLVRMVCVILALVAVGMSTWQSDSLISKWGPWVEDGNEEAIKRLENGPHLEKIRTMFGDELFGETKDRDFENVVSIVIAVILIVSALAAFSAFRARYPRRVYITGALWLLFLIWESSVSGSLLPATRTAINWIVYAAILSTTVYLLRSGLAERSLTIRYVCYALAISAVTILIDLPERVGPFLAVVCLPLMICFSAPWALGRVRHM